MGAILLPVQLEGCTLGKDAWPNIIPSENPHRADLHKPGCIRMWLISTGNSQIESALTAVHLRFRVAVSNLSFSCTYARDTQAMSMPKVQRCSGHISHCKKPHILRSSYHTKLHSICFCLVCGLWAQSTIASEPPF